jgi:hypothetical protein
MVTTLTSEPALSNRNEDGTFFAWDSTMLKSAEKCLRYFQYKMLEGWQPARKSVHLLFGGHYAKALERYHRLRAEGHSLDDALEAVVLLALTETWEITGTRDGEPIGRPWDSMDNNKTRETLIRSIIWYIDEFAEDNLVTVILPDGTAAAEYSFTYPVDDDILLCGHLDRLALYGEEPYVADNKTTGGAITSYFFDQFSPDTQMSLYTFVGKGIFKLPVKGVVIDAAQILVGGTRYSRGFTFRTEEQLTEWYDGIMTLIESANRAVRENHFPMNPGSCGNYGGCEFRGVCSKSPKQRDLFLRADFTRQPRWNPLERR